MATAAFRCHGFGLINKDLFSYKRVKLVNCMGMVAAARSRPPVTCAGASLAGTSAGAGAGAAAGAAAAAGFGADACSLLAFSAMSSAYSVSGDISNTFTSTGGPALLIWFRTPWRGIPNLSFLKYGPYTGCSESGTILRGSSVSAATCCCFPGAAASSAERLSARSCSEYCGSTGLSGFRPRNSE